MAANGGSEPVGPLADQVKGLSNDVSYAAEDEFEDQDAIELAKMGKKQVLRRSFGFWSMFGLSLSVTITWEGALILFQYGLLNGGTAGVVYEYVFTWIGNFCIIASLAELASIMPVAGGQYHFVYALSPPSVRSLLSYIAGWHSVLAWQATLASAVYFLATLIQGLVLLNYPDYEPHRWHGFLLMYAILIPNILINAVLPKFLPQFEWLALVLHVMLFPAILIPIVVLAPHGNASELFARIERNGGYSSAGLTFLVGSVGSVFAFLGADSASHLAEEVINPSRNVPLVMVGTLLFNGTLGFAMMIAIVFCIGNVNAALNTPTGYPFIEIFAQAVDNLQGSTAMTAFILTIGAFSTFSMLAAASRMTWAFARDRGIPGSRWIGSVDERAKVPLWSIGLTVLITMLLAPISIGSPVAFNAFVSLAVSGSLGSFILPVGLYMYQRIKNPGVIKPGRFSLGPMRWPINIIGLLWVIVAMFFGFWPSIVPVTAAKDMNWSCLIYGVMVIFASAFYALSARKHYNGPIVEILPLEHKV